MFINNLQSFGFYHEKFLKIGCLIKNNTIFTFSKKKKNHFRKFFFLSSFFLKINFYLEKNRFLGIYHSSLNKYEILTQILNILLKKKALKFYIHFYELNKHVYFENWLEGYKKITYSINLSSKYFFLVQKTYLISDFNFYINKNLLFIKKFHYNCYHLNKKNKTILTCEKKATICQNFFKCIFLFEFRESFIQRSLLNKVSLNNLKDLKNNTINFKSNLFKVRILILEIFGKIKQEFCYYDLYGTICFITFLICFEKNRFYLSYLIFFLNFQCKNEIEKIENQEKNFYLESQTDIFFKFYFIKKNVNYLFVGFKNQKFYKINFLEFITKTNLLFLFLIGLCVKNSFHLFNTNNKLIKCYWIELLWIVLGKKIATTYKKFTCNFIKILLFLKKNIKRTKKKNISLRVFYIITKILVYNFYLL